MRFIGSIIKRLAILGALVGIGTAAFRYFRDPMHRRRAQDLASTAASTAGQVAARAGETVQGAIKRGESESDDETVQGAIKRSESESDDEGEPREPEERPGA